MIFLDDIILLPPPANAEQAEQCFGDFVKGLGALAEEPAAKSALSHPNTSKLLGTLFGSSPFLTWCALADPANTLKLLEEGPDSTFESTIKILNEKRKETLNLEESSRLLRISRRTSALAIAAADVGGVWSLHKVTDALSLLAETSLSFAMCQALRIAANDGALNIKDDDDPEPGSGVIVLGMGKLGARELNYSSDIDLIVLFNPDIIQTEKPELLQKHIVRLTRNLVKLIEERTPEGYVFRTDLRLRPDPGATPLAISTYAAETYYESIGQNWERAAMIKARPVAGDIVEGQRFLKWLSPFVWRKNLDFAAIQDIHAIKRQINARKGGHTIGVHGHNIKLGPGGIREIEFFAQTQQLIWGGREPNLRSASTEEALKALAEFGLCEPETSRELAESYQFLRMLEHRLQMINDEQTQTLPEDDDGLTNLSVFFGYEELNSFKDDLTEHLTRVHGHYGHLFADSPSLGSDDSGGGNLVFTGSDADPETLTTIGNLGYQTPETVDGTVRAWHHGRYRSTRSTRAREILTELMPTLLTAIGNTPDPDATFLRFDEFLAGLPAGVQLFSMFQTHPSLLDLVAQIMGQAPRLARHLANRPSVLDGVLAPDFFSPPPDKEMMKQELERQLERAELEEDILNTSRRWTHDRRFQIGVQRLQGLIAPQQAAKSHSDIAEAALSAILPLIHQEFGVKHGHIEGASMAILALGKLGSQEMTASSDLDLVFIYDIEELSTSSDGQKPLMAAQYFGRLSQRFINALTAMTPEGVLFEVDMRLRPSGNSGPIATSLAAFEKYQHETAWTWEHMALTRARTVAGNPELCRKTNAIIRHVLTTRRDPSKLLQDVAEMRERIAREKPPDGIWSLKTMRGGIIDIEFVAQFLSLRHGAAHPEILSSNTSQALAQAADAGLVPPSDARDLREALALWHGLQGMLNLTIGGDMSATKEAEMSDDLRACLAEIAGTATTAEMENKIRSSASRCHDLYKKIIEYPAREAAALLPD